MWEEKITLTRESTLYLCLYENTKSAKQRLEIRKKEFSILVLGSHSLSNNSWMNWIFKIKIKLTAPQCTLSFTDFRRKKPDVHGWVYCTVSRAVVQIPQNGKCSLLLKIPEVHSLSCTLYCKSKGSCCSNISEWKTFSVAQRYQQYNLQSVLHVHPAIVQPS
jgi:hypothetical protein